jgi:hypothetical protein
MAISSSKAGEVAALMTKLSLADCFTATILTMIVFRLFIQSLRVSLSKKQSLKKNQLSTFYHYKLLLSSSFSFSQKY